MVLTRGFGVLVLRLAVGAIALAATSPAEAQPAYWFDHVHVTLEAGPSPFGAVVYAVRSLDGHAVAMQTKSYSHVEVYDNRAALVEADELAELMSKLVGEGALELTDAGAGAPFVLTWRVEVAWQGKTNAFSVTGPELLSDVRYTKILELVREFINARTGPAFYRDLAIPEEDMGILNLHSYPPADVEIDGVPLGRRTPVQSFEIKAGPHVASLKVPEMAIFKRIKFNIKKSDITTINLRLIELE